VEFADDGSGVERRLPVLLEVGDVVADVLGPGLRAHAARERAAQPIRTIVEERLLTPHFQPIVALDTGAIQGFEALTRFANGQGPDQVFKEARLLDLGVALERVTLVAAIHEAHHLPGRPFLSLNVSPELVLSPELEPLLASSRRPLVLELSEHVPVDDYEALRESVTAIRPGVSLAVDDAGSGYASLRHILALRPAYAKLDLTLVREIDRDPARQALLVGLVEFSRELGCQLVAEGIEREEERESLLRLGVAMGQGFLFGRPQPIRAAAEPLELHPPGNGLTTRSAASPRRWL